MVIQSVLTPKQTDNLYREKLKQKGCNYPNSYDNLEYLLFSDKLDLSGISSKKRSNLDAWLSHPSYCLFHTCIIINH